MPHFLLELFSEEIPARMQRQAGEDLKKLVTNALVEAGCLYEDAQIYTTPRRLTLHVVGLPRRQADAIEEKKGPRVGAPEGAIQGFLKAAGLNDLSEAKIESDPKKGDFYVAHLEKKGRPTIEVLADLLPPILRTFPWPKSMRWGAASTSSSALRWVRPLRSILALFGAETEETEIVPMDLDGLKSGRVTYGHRFMSPGAIKVQHFDDYSKKLEAAKVVLDSERRKNIIRTDAKNLSFAQGLEVVEDEALLDEISGLVEWPMVLMGSFDPAFLAVPAEVIRATIRHNQKCFVLRPSGADVPKLANKFFLVANIAAKDDGQTIVAGNERVIRARLSDAKFFYETDCRLWREDQSLKRLEKFKNVTFHEKLGSQAERIDRIRALAAQLCKVTGANPALVDRAALLCKADLLTEVVGEFPELQGLMGRKYANLIGESPSVAAACEEHYKPLGPGDFVPKDKVSIALALADKLDLLTAFWAIDEKPTGSKDPYALRRAALGVIRLLVENGLHLPLASLGQPEFINQDGGVLRIEHAGSTLDASLLAFFHDRLKVMLREKGARYDLVDAVLGSGAANDDLLRVVERVEALAIFLATEEGQSLLAGFKRAANILRAEEKKEGAGAFEGAIQAEFLVETSEKALYAVLSFVKEAAEKMLETQDFEGAMRMMSMLRTPLDAFFEAVLVNAPEAEKRRNRLVMLANFRKIVLAIADFSKITG